MVLCVLHKFGLMVVAQPYIMRSTWSSDKCPFCIKLLICRQRSRNALEDRNHSSNAVSRADRAIKVVCNCQSK